jgi:hypothetical protein
MNLPEAAAEGVALGPSAVGRVTSTTASTIDAEAPCRMTRRRPITGRIVDGPLAFDNAINLQDEVTPMADATLVLDAGSSRLEK